MDDDISLGGIDTAGQLLKTQAYIYSPNVKSLMAH